MIFGKMAPGHCDGVVKNARFTEEQMARSLREVDKAPVAEVAEKHGAAARRSTAGESATER